MAYDSASSPVDAMNSVDAFSQVSLYWAFQDGLTVSHRLRHLLAGDLSTFLAALATLSTPERAELKSALVEFAMHGSLAGDINVRDLCTFVEAQSYHV